MNFIKAIELDAKLSALDRKKASQCQIYDAQNEGYCIVIQKEKANGTFLDQLSKIAGEQHLKLEASGKFYIVCSPFTSIKL